MRVLNSVQDHVQAAAGRRLLQRGVVFGRAESDDALMRRAIGRAVKLLARLEAHGNAALFAKRDQFLQPRASRAFSDQNPVHRTAGAQGLADGMDSSEREHYDK